MVIPISVHQTVRKTEHQFENRYKLADKANSASFQEACAGKGYEGIHNLEILFLFRINILHILIEVCCFTSF